MKKHHILSKLIAAATCTVLACTQPLQAFAATSSTYLSDIVISYGDTPEEAKQWLTDHGWKILDQNLNEKAEGMRSAKAVYVGYKTTRNASEAITDLKLMNMNGDFSYTDYQEWLESRENDAREYVSILLPALEEYRKNYEKGKDKANFAYLMLNTLYDSDTMSGLGDLLLKPVREEYSIEEWENLSEDEQQSAANITKMMMLGNTGVLLSMEQYLTFACDVEADTWKTRLETLGTYDNFYTPYDEEYEGYPYDSVLTKEYDRDAKVFAECLPALLSYNEKYESYDVTPESSGEEVNSFLESATRTEFDAWEQSSAVALLLNTCEFDGTSLLDLFADESCDYLAERDDREMLYPLIQSLSEGQKSMMKLVSLDRILIAGALSNADYTELITQYEDACKDAEPLSIYQGVETDMFDGNVAMTKTALQLQNSSDDVSYIDKWYDKCDWDAWKMAAIIGSGIAGAVSWKCFKIYNEHVHGIGTADFVDAEHPSEGFQFDPDAENLDELFEEDMVGASAFQEKSSSLYRYIGTALCVIAVLLSVISIGVALYNLYQYYNPTYHRIPKYIVNKQERKDADPCFTYYHVAECNRYANTQEVDPVLMTYGDLNGDIGKEWLSLYYTKDPAAGAPIYSNLKTVVGSKTAATGYQPLTLFGYSNAQNLVDTKYSFEDNVGGIYLYFQRGSAAATDSVFTVGIYAVIGAAAAVIGFAVSYLIAKPRKKETAKEA